jgi:hypothetical protein
LFEITQSSEAEDVKPRHYKRRSLSPDISDIDVDPKGPQGFAPVDSHQKYESQHDQDGIVN